MLCSRVQKFSFCSGVIISLHRCWPRFAGRSCQYQVCFPLGEVPHHPGFAMSQQQHSELQCSLAVDGFLKKISLNGHMLHCKLWQLFEENAPRLWETSYSWQLLSKVISLPWKLRRQTSRCWEKRQSMPPPPAGEEACQMLLIPGRPGAHFFRQFLKQACPAASGRAGEPVRFLCVTG